MSSPITIVVADSSSHCEDIDTPRDDICYFFELNNYDSDDSDTVDNDVSDVSNSGDMVDNSDGDMDEDTQDYDSDDSDPTGGADVATASECLDTWCLPLHTSKYDPSSRNQVRCSVFDYLNNNEILFTVIILNWLQYLELELIIRGYAIYLDYL